MITLTFSQKQVNILRRAIDDYEESYWDDLEPAERDEVETIIDTLYEHVTIEPRRSDSS